MTSIQEKSRDLLTKIYSEDYYLSQFNVTLKRSGLTSEMVKNAELSDGILVSLWNTFWFALPDTSEIHRDPFFDLCDLAESGYDDDVVID